MKNANLHGAHLGLLMLALVSGCGGPTPEKPVDIDPAALASKPFPKVESAGDSASSSTKSGGFPAVKSAGDRRRP